MAMGWRTEEDFAALERAIEALRETVDNLADDAPIASGAPLTAGDARVLLDRLTATRRVVMIPQIDLRDTAAVNAYLASIGREPIATR